MDSNHGSRTPPRLQSSGLPNDESHLITPPQTGGFRRYYHAQDLVHSPGSPPTTPIIYQPGLLSPEVKQGHRGGRECGDHQASHCHVVDREQRHQEPGDGAFRFLDLPLIVRNEIYKLLLTVNGLVCVRQNRTPGSYEHGAYVGAEERQLRPGIAFVLVQEEVSGMKSRFHTHPYINSSILFTNRAIYAEAKKILYSANTFNLANLTRETAPPVDFRTPLFPRGYSTLIRKLSISSRTLYGFRYLIAEGGYRELKNAYCGLTSLALVLELDETGKGIGRKLDRNHVEKWAEYVTRLETVLGSELFGTHQMSSAKAKLPPWIDLKVRFTGDSLTAGQDEDTNYKKKMIKQAVGEAFILFKKVTPK